MRLPAKVLLVVAVSFALIASCGIAAVLLINNVLKQGKLSVGEAREFDEFPLYWLGESYRGLALTEINKFGFPSETLPSKPTVRFTYGDETCVKSSCSAPIWIWIDPYCESTPEQELAWMQHLASLPEYHDHSISDVKVRGVKGYLFGTRIHLWTETSHLMIDVKTTDPSTTQVAEDLIPLNEDSGATPRPLPPPITTPC